MIVAAIRSISHLALGISFYAFFSAAVVVGGIDMMTQALQLAKKPHFIVGK